VQCWGAGGAAGSAGAAEGGGGGGAFSRKTVTKTHDTATIVVGAGGTGVGGDSSFSQGGTDNVLAKGGSAGVNFSSTGGAGGDAASGVGDVTRSGGDGASASGSGGGGGGGAAASRSADGGDGQTNSGSTGGAGGIAPYGGGNGGAGGNSGMAGGNGVEPGGGGGGGGTALAGSRGLGANGKVKVSWALVPESMGTQFSSGCCCGSICESCGWGVGEGVDIEFTIAGLSGSGTCDCSTLNDVYIETMLPGEFSFPCYKSNEIDIATCGARNLRLEAGFGVQTGFGTLYHLGATISILGGGGGGASFGYPIEAGQVSLVAALRRFCKGEPVTIPRTSFTNGVCNFSNASLIVRKV